MLGAFFVPSIAIFTFDFIPEGAKIVIFLGFIIGMTVYFFKNLFNLMMLDEALASFQCYLTARKQFELPYTFSAADIEKKLLTFGDESSPTPTLPQPNVLRYKFNRSLLIYASGIEKVVSTYHIDLLDARSYQAIFLSAKANSNVLKGRKKAGFLDKSQKDSPLNRVTVPIIFASRIDSNFSKSLYKTICDQEMDGFDLSFLPCIIDLEKNICIFNSERIAYVGFGYPVKNRGVRIIRKYVFGGKLPLEGNPHLLEISSDIDPEQSLWDYWGKINNEGKELDEEIKKDNLRFESMSPGQIIWEDSILYLKFDERGLEIIVELNEETKKVEVSPIISWDYPKPNLISKSMISEIQDIVEDYFFKLGYSCEFIYSEQ